MSYTAQNIRNVALLGHGSTGKTSLVESMLYMTGVLDRQGKTPDGNTVSDYDAEEIKRQISISTAVAPLEHDGCKINVLDTPGNYDFSGDVQEALRVTELGIIVCDAKGGLSVGTERAWRMLDRSKMPRFIYVSKTDEDNGDFNGTVEALRNRFGRVVSPLIIPIADEHKHVTAIVDVVSKKAYTVEKGKQVEIPIPADKAGEVDEQYDALMENVAETSEELMEKYFDGETFTPEEVLEGLRTGVREESLVPVFCGSALTGLGTMALLKGIVDLAPNPLEAAPEVVTNEDGEEEEFTVDPAGMPAALVFKTISDQYGKYSYVKVLSGTVTSDLSLTDATTGSLEKLGRLYTMRGKKATEVKELTCGDIGAIAKMDKVHTGDTLCDARKVVKFAGISFPEPNYQKAIVPKTRGQEEKVASGLSRLNEEDPSFTFANNAETRQMVITAVGDIQIDVLVAKLKGRFGVEAVLEEPRVPYREKIRKTVDKHGRHKKQTGGSGQFGDVWIRFEPCDSEEMVFEEEVVGGSVPKQFFPAVEKGLREACVHGVLAGYPVVNLKAVLHDGSYHPVDSSEIAFKTAAQIAYRAALPEANPVMLEPVGELKVTVPDSYMGDVIGDLNKRRGRVMGMNPTDDGDQIIEAEVPMAEMTSYAIELRAMTQSRGTFTFHFIRYEECPPAAQAKAIEDAKALNAE